MTTIAFDGKEIACDSLECGGAYTSKRHKIFKEKNEYIGIAGATSSCLRFVEWYRDGADPKNLPTFQPSADFDFSALVVKEGRSKYFDRDCIGLDMGTKATIGSGSQFAMGAMFAGASAKEAVRIAAKLDESTGGRIKSYSLK